MISCVTIPVGLTSSTTPLQNKVVENNLGAVSGTDTTWSLFCLWMFGRPDIEEAIQDALSQKKGDALINVRCYRTASYWVLFGIHSVRVEGDAVVLKDAEAADAKKKK
jgi:hypothetical protein